MNKTQQAFAIGAVAVGAIALLFLLTGAPANDTPEFVIEGDSTAKTATAPVQTQRTGSVPAAAPASYPSMTKDGIYLVYYTAKGFVPSALKIPAGKSVRFVNDSSKAMRISSTDTTNAAEFAAFNQPKTVGKGGTYEYTFLHRASFTYNNRNVPADQGVIIVE